jgi:hypothetical protein
VKSTIEQREGLRQLATEVIVKNLPKFLETEFASALLAVFDDLEAAETARRNVSCIWCVEVITTVQGQLDNVSQEEIGRIAEACRKHDIQCKKNPTALLLQKAKQRTNRHNREVNGLLAQVSNLFSLFKQVHPLQLPDACACWCSNCGVSVDREVTLCSDCVQTTMPASAGQEDSHA